MTTTTIHISGTHCASCKALLEEVIRELPGVKKASVDFKSGKTVIEHEGELDRKTLKAEVESLGSYKVQEA